MNAIVNTPEFVKTKSIRTDGGTQSRAQLYAQVVAEYTDAIGFGANFPPVVAFFDGSEYWLADGFHRHAAYMALGKDSIPVDVRQGTRRDAILFSVGANAAHGLRRTNEDKRRAVIVLLNDAEWSKWSDREIARQASVSAPLVASVRQVLTVNSYSDEPRTYTNKHGTQSTMNTENIGGSQYTKARPETYEQDRKNWQDAVDEMSPRPEPRQQHDDQPIHKNVMNPKALWLWGRIKDFDREGILRQDPARLFSEMTDPMRADVRRFLPEVIGFLSAMEQSQ